MPVSELLTRLTSYDLSEYMAYYHLKAETEKKIRTEAELEAKAKANLNGNNRKPIRRRNR